MANTPSDNPRQVNLSLKLTHDENRTLDKDRGTKSKSSYIRSKLFPNL